mgnify:CR=1 FL=1
MGLFGKKEAPAAGEMPKTAERPKGFREMIDEGARRRQAFEASADRSIEARKAQGSALLSGLWNRAKGWGIKWGGKLLSGAKTGVELGKTGLELGKKGVSGTADALFLDVGDMGTALKAKAGEKLEVAGDALYGALDSGLKKAGAAADTMGNVAFKGIEMGVSAYKNLDRRTIDASNRLGARVDDIKTRATARYQEWQDNRPKNRIARLEALVRQLQSQLQDQAQSNTAAA